jgi:hypothetical protein
VGALTLWILFVVWLKKRKRARGFKQLEDPAPKDSSAESNGMKPFVPPPPVIHNPVHSGSKRPVSSVTSIADTVTHSKLHAGFMTETLSKDPYAVANSSEPFILGPYGYQNDAKGL